MAFVLMPGAGGQSLTSFPLINFLSAPDSHQPLHLVLLVSLQSHTSFCTNVYVNSYYTIQIIPIDSAPTFIRIGIIQFGLYELTEVDLTNKHQHHTQLLSTRDH